ncbi:membrane protein [Paractinoplanes abujensis]|nr:membrane protein [Actinoplanes abujensis]
MRRLAVLIAATGLFALSGTAALAAPSDQDATYLKAAHQSNLAEIAGGKIAQQKGTTEQVKNLGARFIADHTKLDAALRQTAEGLGVDLPSAPNSEQQALAERYQAASGDDFDALYVSTQMDAHMKAMSLGRTEIADGSDARAKKVAQDAAPVIASHHDALNAAARAVGVPSGVDSGTGGTADNGGLSTAAIGLIGIGALLVVAAGLLLVRRRTVRA